MINKYTYGVIWSETDQEYVGLCAEFPSLSWLKPTQTEALNGIVHLVRGATADMQKNGETPPEPMPDWCRPQTVLREDHQATLDYLQSLLADCRCGNVDLDKAVKGLQKLWVCTVDDDE